MKSLCLQLFAAAALMATARAQEPTELTLEGCIALAFHQSYAMQSATQRYVSAKKSFEAQSLITGTTVDLSLRLPDYNESLTNQFNPLSQRYEFYQLQTTYLRSDLSVNQPIVLSGGTLSLSGDFFKRNQITGSAGASDELKDYFSNFQLQLQQPLLSANTLRIGRDQARLREGQSSSSFRKDQLDVVFNVTDAFYAAYRSSQEEQISQEQVKQNEESYETARGKYAAGLIPEVEYLQSDVDLVMSKNQLLNNRREASRAKNALKLLLGLRLESAITLKADLRFTPIAVDQETAIRKATENRAELLNALTSREISRMDVDIASSRRRVRLDLTASYGLNRSDTQLESVFRDYGRNRSVALQVSVPLFDWGRHALEVEAAEAEMKSAELTYANTEQQIRQEIIDLLSRISVAESRIEVLAKSVEVAQKGYEISLERFRSGTITSNDIAQAQQRLTNSKLNNLVALIDYRLGVADLTRKTLWDFEGNKPVELPAPLE
jgi:outer membrane protein TolC